MSDQPKDATVRGGWHREGRGALGGAVLVALCWMAVSGADRQELTITGPNGISLSLSADRDQIDQKTLLDEMDADRFARAGLMEWLADKQIYRLTDPMLGHAIARELCEPIPEAPIEQLIEKGQECAANVVAKQLRQLASSRSRPFHYVGRRVEIGVSLDERHRPDDGRANACQEREFSGKRVELTNPKNNKRIEVLATGTYPCSGMGRIPDIQLNSNDASRLFDGALDKYQEAIAAILN